MYELNSGRFLSVGGSVGKSDEPYLMAKMLPVLSEQSLDPVRGQQGRAEPEARKTFTMSALSSESLRRRLIPALADFSRALRKYLDQDFFRATEIGKAMKAAPSFMGGGKELGSFLSLIEFEITTSPALTNAIREVRSALNETVVERRLGTGYQTSDQSFHLLSYRGLGVWIPGGALEYKERASDFALSSFEKETNWQSWLKPALGVRSGP